MERRVRQAITDRRHGAQQNGHGYRAFAVEPQNKIIRLACVKLHPCAAVRHKLGSRHAPASGCLHLTLKVNTRRANELRHNNALGAIDNERAALCHEREVTQENIRLDGIGDFVAGKQHAYIQRSAVGQIALEAFFNRVLNFLKPKLETSLARFFGVAGQKELHAALEGFDRRDLIKQIAQPILLQPFEGRQLHLNHFRQRKIMV